MLQIGIAQRSVNAAPPSRTYNYVAGEVIDPDEVTANEDNLYQYVQTGVDTYADGTVDTDAIKDGTIEAVDIATSAVTTNEILDGTIVGDDVADNTLDAEEIDETDDYTWSGADTWTNTATFTSSVDISSGILVTPNTGDCSGVVDEANLCWDSNDDLLYVGTGTTALAVPELGVPALTFGTANAEGSANTVIRTDATILAFDATLPEELGTASAGSATTCARRDHVHKPSPSQFVEELGIVTPSVDTTFAGNAMNLNEAGSDNTILKVYRPTGLNTMDAWILADTVNAGGNAQYAISFDNGATCYPNCTTGTQATDDTWTQIVTSADVSGESSGWLSLYVFGQNDSGSDDIELEALSVTFR